MKKTMVALALAGLAAMPALAAIEQGQTKQVAMPRTVAGRMTLFEMVNYSGDTVEIDQPRTTVHTDWNIRSLTIHPGDRWEICARPRFRDCIILDRSVPDASAIGIQGQIGSARLAPTTTGSVQAPNLMGNTPPPRTN
jgi:hypothetical protein